VLSLVLAVAMCACGSRIDPQIRVSDIRIYEPLPGNDVAVAYLKLHNDGAGRVRIAGVASKQFARVEFHETNIVNGISRMQPMKPPVIRARSTLEFKPGAAHIMLTSPQHTMQSGANVSLLFRFDNGGELQVDTTLQSRATKPSPQAGS
jgi:copper(I)-binding protein